MSDKNSTEQIVDMAHLARLAKLELKAEDLERLSKQCADILSYMDSLSAVDTEHVAPMYSPFELEKSMRPDIVRQSVKTEDLLANAPKKTDEYFIVPKIV